MLTYQAFYQHELLKLISQEIENIKENVISGFGIEEFSDYRYHIGRIQGLRRALELCEEAEQTVNRTETRG